MKDKKDNYLLAFHKGNAFRQASANAIKRVFVDAELKKYQNYDQVCAQWYVTVAPMNDIALFSLNDAIEQLKASPKWKKKGIRKSCEDAQRLAKRYEHILYSKIRDAKSKDPSQYFMDYMDSWQDETKLDVDILRFSISNALLRMNYRWDVELASWVFTAWNMLSTACRCFDAYFRGAEKEVGENYSKAFYDGRMTKIQKAFEVAARSFDPNHEYPLPKDEMCVRAVRVIMNRFLLTDVSEKSAESAISLNPNIEDEFEEVHKEIEGMYSTVRSELEKRVGL